MSDLPSKPSLILLIICLSSHSNQTSEMLHLNNKLKMLLLLTLHLEEAMFCCELFQEEIHCAGRKQPSINDTNISLQYPFENGTFTCSKPQVSFSKTKAMILQHTINATPHLSSIHFEEIKYFAKQLFNSMEMWWWFSSVDSWLWCLIVLYVVLYVVLFIWTPSLSTQYKPCQYNNNNQFLATHSFR